MSEIGPSRPIAVLQYFGRFRERADIAQASAGSCQSRLTLSDIGFAPRHSLKQRVCAAPWRQSAVRYRDAFRTKRDRAIIAFQRFFGPAGAFTTVPLFLGGAGFKGGRRWGPQETMVGVRGSGGNLIVRASSKLPSGLCVETVAPSMSTRPAESMTMSADRASAPRVATAEVATPTISATFSNNPRRLTS